MNQVTKCTVCKAYSPNGTNVSHLKKKTDHPNHLWKVSSRDGTCTLGDSATLFRGHFTQVIPSTMLDKGIPEVLKLKIA